MPYGATGKKKSASSSKMKGKFKNTQIKDYKANVKKKNKSTREVLGKKDAKPVIKKRKAETKAVVKAVKAKAKGGVSKKLGKAVNKRRGY